MPHPLDDSPPRHANVSGPRCNRRWSTARNIQKIGWRIERPGQLAFVFSGSPVTNRGPTKKPRVRAKTKSRDVGAQDAFILRPCRREPGATIACVPPANKKTAILGADKRRKKTANAILLGAVGSGARVAPFARLAPSKGKSPKPLPGATCHKSSADRRWYAKIPD